MIKRPLNKQFSNAVLSGIKTTTISCFSAGVSSAVATKLALPYLDDIIYIHIEDQHPDSTLNQQNHDRAINPYSIRPILS